MKLLSETIVDLKEAANRIASSDIALIYSKDFSILFLKNNTSQIKIEDVEKLLASPDFRLAVVIPERNEVDRRIILTLIDEKTLSFKLTEYEWNGD